MGPTGDRAPTEVELVATEGHASSLPTDSATLRDGTEPPGGPTGGHRSVLVPLVVGLVALGVGWTIGRGSAGPSQGPVVSGPTESADPVGSIEPVRPTADGEPPTPTTEPASDSGVEVDVEAVVGDAVGDTFTERDAVVSSGLRGQPVQIVAYGNGRQLFRLDLATSRLASQEVATQPFGRTRLLVGPSWALLASNDPVLSSTLVFDDGTTVLVDVGPSRQIVGTADAGALWTVVPGSGSTDGSVVQRRSVQGQPDREIAIVPSMPTSIDPAGGVVVQAPGGTFRVLPRRAVTEADSEAAPLVEPDVALITNGRLLALGDRIAVAEECDTALVCGIFAIDRNSGERRPIGDDSPGLAPYARAGASSVAPDGGAAAVEVLEPTDRASTQRSLGVVDLTTGELTELGPTQDIDQVEWTPDGRFVLFLAGGRLAAYDTESDETVVVATALVAIDAFGIRVRDD